MWIWESLPGNEYECVDVKQGHTQVRLQPHSMQFPPRLVPLKLQEGCTISVWHVFHNSRDNASMPAVQLVWLLMLAGSRYHAALQLLHCGWLTHWRALCIIFACTASPHERTADYDAFAACTIKNATFIMHVLCASDALSSSALCTTLYAHKGF